MTIELSTSEQFDIVLLLREKCGCEGLKGHKCKDKDNKYCKLCSYFMSEFIKQS